MDILIESFNRKCRIKGLGANTIEGYKYSLSIFRSFYIGSLDELTQEHIDLYIEHLLKTYPNLTTVNNKLRDLRVFLRWAGKSFDISLIKKNDPEITPLENAQLKEIYAACLEVDNPKNYNGKGYCHYRDYIIMRMLEETGMRISESLKLQTKDIDIRLLTIQLRETKNKKPRVTFFTQSLCRELKTYLELRKKFLSTKETSSSQLFVNNMGQPISYRTISQNITNYGELAGVVGVRVSPHTFRHTFAKNFLINGGDIFTLKDILGHSTFDMVYRYARLFNRERQEKYSEVMEQYSKSKKRANR